MASQQVINALESLHRQLEKLEPAIKHVETAQQVTQTVKIIPGKHLELIEEIKTQSLQHKNELKKLFGDEIDELSAEHIKLTTVTKEILSNIQAEVESISKLKEDIKAFHGKIEGIHFPERLDKLDANIAGIMAAIQSLYGRIEGIERNLSDRMKEVLDWQKEGFNKTHADISSLSKTQKISNYITWGLLLAIIVLMFLKLK